MFLASLFLSLIPVITIRLQYIFSKKDNKLGDYKNHWTTYVGDYVFVPLNFLFLYSFFLDIKTILFSFILSLFANSFQHYLFVQMYKKPGSSFHMVSIKNKNLTKAGWVHLLFSTYQLTILLSALFLTPMFPQFYLFVICTFSVSIMFLYGSKQIHGKIITYDYAVAITLFAGILTKFFIT